MRFFWLLLLASRVAVGFAPLRIRTPNVVGSTAFTKGLPACHHDATSTLSMTQDDYHRKNYYDPDGPDAWRNDLPFPLNKYRERCLQGASFVYPNGDQINIFIIGTVHIWNQSATDVRLLLEKVQPDIIFTELCIQRYQIMVLQASLDEWEKDLETNPNEPSKMILEEYKKAVASSNTGGSRMERLVFKYINRLVNEAQEKSGALTYGGEMMAAYRYWEHTKGDAPIVVNGQPTLPILVLGDRPFDITLSRACESFRKRDVFKFLAPPPELALIIGGISSLFWFRGLLGVVTSCAAAWFLVTRDFDEDIDIESFDDLYITEPESYMYKNETCADGDKIDALFDQMELPVHDIIGRERDIYMASKLSQSLGLLHVEDHLDREPKTFNAVAIVGALHVKGMMETFRDQIGNATNEKELLLPLLDTKRLKYSEEQLNSFAETVYCATSIYESPRV